MRGILLCFFVFFVQYSFGQKVIYETVNKSLRGSRLKSTELFSLDEGRNNRLRESFKADSLTYLKTNQEALQLITREKPEFLSFNLPLKDGKNHTIDVLARDIHATGFTVVNARNEPVIASKETYYRGIIRGDENSLVAFSISEKGINGFISDETGNYELIKSKDDSRHLFYSAKGGDSPKFECMVSDTTKLSGHIQHSLSVTEVTKTINCAPITIYFEADHSVFQGLGSVQAVTDYVNQLFVQVATLYENEGINIAISQLKVWDTPDPYVNSTNMFEFIDGFTETWIQNNSSISADIGHAISFKYGGGIAGLDVLSPDNRNIATGVSTGLNTTINTYPTYSGNVKLLAHELGHNLGSPHTHWCGWPGGSIDNCYSPEGNCPPGKKTENGGTIMSYCLDVNFSHGFGPLPGDLIRSRISSYRGVNIPPQNVTISNIYSDQAYLTWEHPYKESKFFVDYKPQNSSEWNSTETLNAWLGLKQLSPNTEYNYRIRTECSSYLTGTFQTSGTTGYCYSDFTYSTCWGPYSPFGIPLSSVSVGGKVLSQSSSCNNNGYTLVPSLTRFQVGETYDFSIEVNRSMNVAIWIDLNGNKEFEESEKVFFSEYTGQHTGIVSGNFTIPEDVGIVYSTRMRITAYPIGDSALPCNTYSSGEEEDYIVDIIDCVEETAPSSLFLNDLSGDKAVVSWSHQNIGPFYVEYKTIDEDAWNRLWVDSKVAEFSNLVPHTSYNWRVRTECSPFAESSFVTIKQDYCEFKDYVESGCSFLVALNKVTLDNTILSQESGCSPNGYTLFNNTPKQLIAGQTYSFSLEQIGSLNPAQTAIWIDVNNNGIFEDNEKLFSTNNETIGPINGELTIPYSVFSEVTVRMRVVLQGFVSPENPCWLTMFGEAEDYLISLVPCQVNNSHVPFSPTLRTVYDKGAVVSWNGSPGYTYLLEYKKENSQEWKNAGETTEHSYHLNNLNPSTLYNWRVRTACSSEYVTGMFLTKPASSFCQISYGSASCVVQFGINSFNIESVILSNNSGCNSEAYTFFPNTTVDLKIGETYNFTLGLVGGVQDVHVSIWVDLNDNGLFENEELLFLTSDSHRNSINGTIQIPLNTVAAQSIRLRIILSHWSEIPNSACRSYQLGETEDYLINITPCTANLSPAPTALKSENVYDRGAVLSWNYGSGTPFELEYKKNNEPDWNSIVIENGTSHHLGNLSPNTLYQWRIRAYCSVNFASGSFTTRPPNNYCDVSNQRICNDPYNSTVINGVILDNTVLSSATGCKEGAYEFFPYVVKTLEAGKTYSFSLSMLREDSEFWGAYIWLDLNGNGNFDSNEMLFGTNSTQQGTVSGTLTIPASTQTVLSTRLRITAQLYYEDNPLSPCSVLYPDGPGETEDYLINIYNPCPTEVVLAHPTDNISGGTVIKEASRNHGTIHATNRVTGNANVIYRAKTVELKPGFRSDSSTVFKAEVGGCN
jgi:hypothetical protein